ncbi:MAG: RecX family transcriptional regulator [Caldicoprobacterales bacterium]|jgi:regulatory protein
MKRIVDIQKQKRNQRRYTIHFDDGEWLGLFDELVVKHGLKVDMEVDSQKIAKLAREDDAKKSMDMSLRYLQYRSRSQKEMEDYLEAKGFERDIIDETIDKLKSYGYINDLAFARDWVSHRMATKPMGRAMIKRELYYKGIDNEIIEKSLDQFSENEEEEQAYKLALKYIKRYRNLDTREQFYKIGQALARRGFNWEVAKRALRRLELEEEENL